MDLRSLRSVAEFADSFSQTFSKLDVMVLNAAVFGLDFQLTREDRLEEMFQVNYLSHVYLCQLLLEKFSVAPWPRLVVVSSESHRFADISIGSSLHDKRKDDFISIAAYNRR